MDSSLRSEWQFLEVFLKECRTALKIISKKEIIKPSGKITEIYKETEELIAIIGKSIKTAQKNKGKLAPIWTLNIECWILNIIF